MDSPLGANWGLYSHARLTFMPDPELMDGTALRFESFMDAARAACNYHFSFELEPREFTSGKLDRELTGYVPQNRTPICEVCLVPFGPDELEDGVTPLASCCGRPGMCSECGKKGNHDCDEPASYWGEA